MRGSRSAVLCAAIVLLAACSSGGSTSVPPSAASSSAGPPPSSSPVALASATSGRTSAPPSSRPYRSRLYGYGLGGEWTGAPTTQAWDGTGTPGDGDPFVDVLFDQSGGRAWAYGRATTSTLADYAAAARTTNAGVHPCPVKPKVTEPTTVGGSPAIYDEHDCGVVALTAYVVRDGRATVFFTYGQPENEAKLRQSFESLLKVVTFE
jgi:hypothetical protein